METLPKHEMQRLTRALRSKADKIRALGRAGVGPADIGRFLGIRYQHAYNVLKRSKISFGEDAVRDAERDASESAPAKTVLDESGCIRLPDRILESWGASAGDELLVRIEGEELRVLTRAAGLRQAKEIVRRYGRGSRGMADELIAERRSEAERGDD